MSLGSRLPSWPLKRQPGAVETPKASAPEICSFKKRYRPLLQIEHDWMTYSCVRRPTEQLPTGIYRGVQDDTIRNTDNSSQIPKISRRQQSEIQYSLKPPRKYDIRRYTRNSEEMKSLQRFSAECRPQTAEDGRNVLIFRDFIDTDEHDYLTESDHVAVGLKHLRCLPEFYLYLVGHSGCVSIIKQLLDGLCFILASGLQHNSLDLDNVLFTDEGLVKIGGLHCTGPRNNDCGTTTWGGVLDIVSNLPICCETRHQVGKDGGESQANLHACPVREMERKIKQRYDGSSKTNRSLVDDIQAFCKDDLFEEGKDACLPHAVDITKSKVFLSMIPYRPKLPNTQSMEPNIRESIARVNGEQNAAPWRKRLYRARRRSRISKPALRNKIDRARRHKAR